tara:strand:- start:280 stop:495 length:216 start_codon:yes stop_codon:yes gene_type:complete
MEDIFPKCLGVRMTKKLLSVRDIVEITGWSKSTVYKLIDSGDLQSVQIPMTPIRVPIESLDNLISQGVSSG